jgi:protein SCO1/2/putative membrane protein
VFRFFFSPAGRVLLGLLCSIACVSCSSAGRPADGDVYGSVGSFRLTERSGRTVTQDDLLGQVWIASFQFVRCSGPCPQISQTMQRLQHELANRPNVRLVTFTVDPEHDTPDELTRYAEHFGADPERWWFLTGKEEDIYRLLREGFRVHAAQRTGSDRTPGREVEHTQKLVVVDRHGRIRGYYDGLISTDPNYPDDPKADFELGLKKLRRQVDHLLLPDPVWYLPPDFPRFNAGLNTLCTLLLIFGYLAIRTRQVRLHATCMVSALLVSALFLASYLYFHIVIKGGRPTRFSDQAIGAPQALEYLYLTILGTHTLLAIVATPLALFTAYQGLWGNIRRHVRVARWTLPIWLYVSVTGVVVYWMLYQLYP